MGDKNRKRELERTSPVKKKSRDETPLSKADLDAAIASGIMRALQEQQNDLDRSINFAVKHAMDTLVVPQLRQIQSDIVKNNEGMKGVQNDLDKHAKVVNQTKTRVDHIQVVVRSHTEDLEQLRTQVEQLTTRTTEMQDRARRNNIRLVRLGEHLEGKDAVGYLTKNLPKWIPALAGRHLEIERAHRIYTDPKKRDTFSDKPPPPRTMIFRMLRWQDKMDILREARKAYPIKLGESTLLFFQDFSPETTARRKKFNTAISEARDQGLQPFLLYPATLQIEHGGKKTTFDCHQKAESSIRALKRPDSYANAAKSPPLHAQRRAGESSPPAALHLAPMIVEEAGLFGQNSVGNGTRTPGTERTERLALPAADHPDPTNEVGVGLVGQSSEDVGLEETLTLPTTPGTMVLGEMGPAGAAAAQLPGPEEENGL